MTRENWVSTSTPYVAPRRHGQRDAWAEEAEARGRVGSQRVVEVGEVTAPAEVTRKLGEPEGSSLVVRRRVIYLDDTPVELTDTYYPLAVARGTRLAQKAKIRGGAVTLLAELGYEPRSVHEEVFARMPNGDERQVLGLGSVDPVLCLTRVTEDGVRPFQVDVSVFRATEQRLRYDMKVG
ncbi:UTRA domain-containing protein [Streptomyces sp. NPDC005438]|uniref:GntR family transcriptional regulator n=1 Tax=Streptomyces sp. NPDC005438 TaxID=3156880 RepID=UPI0033BBF83A